LLELNHLTEINGARVAGSALVKMMQHCDGSVFAAKPPSVQGDPFRRELDVLTKLNHLCIVSMPPCPISDDESRGTIVMEHKENGSLGDVLEKVTGNDGNPPKL